MRIVFFLRSLGHGGAQRQMAVLARGLSESGHEVAVVSFYPGGPVEEELRAAGLRLHSLDKRGRWDVGPFLLRAARLLRRLRPQVLHGYLAVPNIVSILLKPVLPGTRIVMGVRASEMDLALYDRLARLTYGLERLLSRFADRVIVNSRAGRAHAAACGFPPDRLVVIPNGIDTASFRRDAEGRRRVRAEWGVPGRGRLVGLVARLDPIKGHRTFLEAAAALAAEAAELRFVCVGDGPDPLRRDLERTAGDLGIGERVVWAGGRTDMPAVYTALDVLCSASYGEGFPNVVAEAMACGVPCVVTDVGDSAEVVGETGLVVPPRDAAALAEGLRTMLRRTGTAPASPEAVRARIVERFGLEVLVRNTETELEALP